MVFTLLDSDPQRRFTFSSHRSAVSLPFVPSSSQITQNPSAISLAYPSTAFKTLSTSLHFTFHGQPNVFSPPFVPLYSYVNKSRRCRGKPPHRRIFLASPAARLIRERQGAEGCIRVIKRREHADFKLMSAWFLIPAV